LSTQHWFGRWSFPPRCDSWGHWTGGLQNGWVAVLHRTSPKKS